MNKLTNKDIINFIREIFHEPTKYVPLHAPVFNGNEKKYLCDCIESTYVSSVGEYVDLFELEIARYTGSKEAVVCVNGTNALHLALKLIGVKENDEVITQALTFIATANAILYCGAKPVFIDVDKETMGLSPDAVKKWLLKNGVQKNGECYNKNTGKRIKACVPMHTFSHPVKLKELIRVCDEFNLELVEDAAESLGSFYDEKHTGTFGEIGILSFNGNKIITTGGGGMLLFKNEKLAEKAKHLTTQAKINHEWEFKHDEVGYNYRMPNLNAALGLAQLEQLTNFIDKKRNLAMKYKDFFQDSNVEFFSEPINCKSSYWLNSIIFKNQELRDLFLTESNKSGIMTRPIWELLINNSFLSECQRDELTCSKDFASRVVNIPSSVI